MQDRNLPLPLLLGAVALSRWVFRSHYLYDIDSVNFALALERFDPVVHQPHPPGYFLYVWLGRLIHGVTGDANAAFVAISIAAGVAAAWALWRLAEDWFGGRAARIAGALFLFSPLCWFHGVVALTYMVECFFSALMGLLCWRLYSGRASNPLPASVVLGLAAGFRPSTLLFLGPLWAVSVWRAGPRRLAPAAAALGAAILAWLVPMTHASGGAGAYLDALSHLWRTVPGKQTLAGSPIFVVLARILTMAWIAVLCFGTAAAAILLRRTRESQVNRRAAVFTWIWVTPGLLFFSLVFLNYVNSGYLLVIAPPAFVWLGGRIGALTEGGGRRAAAALAAGAAANAAIFLFAPVYCSHAAIRAFETDLAQIQRGIRARIDPRTTMIVSFDSHFLGYRHAGYYLPEFFTVQYPEVAYPQGPRVFAMHGRDTRLLASLPLACFDRFVAFPLPRGGEYDAHLAALRARLGAAGLRGIDAGGRQLISGPVAALPVLFHSTGSLPPPVPVTGARANCKHPFTADLPDGAHVVEDSAVRSHPGSGRRIAIR